MDSQTQSNPYIAPSQPPFPDIYSGSLQGDDVVEDLVSVLRTTLNHPEWRELAEVTLSKVHEIQQAASRKLALQERDLIAQRLYLLVDEIAAALRVNPAKLRSPGRPQHLSLQRHIAMFLCRRVTRASFPQIANAFHRTHTSVMHGCDVVEARMARDPGFRLFIARLESQVKLLELDGAGN